MRDILKLFKLVGEGKSFPLSFLDSSGLSKNCIDMRQISRRKTNIITYILDIWGFPGSSSGREPPASAGDAGSIPGSGRSPEGLRGMAVHSSILAWRTLWTEESGGLWSIGLQSQTRLTRPSTHTCTYRICTHRYKPGGSAVKNPPAVQETRVLSLGLEDPLGEELST